MIKSGTILLIIVSVLLSLFAFIGCSASQSENNGSNQITQSSTEDTTTETIREDIGQWVDEGWPGGAIITITREDEGIILDIKFNDDSHYTREMVEKTVAGQQHFEEKGSNDFGEYYVITARGDLDLYDEIGYIRTAHLKK